MKMQYVKPTYTKIEKPDSKGNFFVRLAYGVVGGYMDTKNMTTSEVIEEFLKHNGVKTPREFFNNKFKGKANPKNSDASEKESKIQTENETVYNDRVQFTDVMTKEFLTKAFAQGGEIGKVTAQLFKQDHYSILNINNQTTSAFSPNYNHVGLKNDAIQYNENGIYTPYETFYHESWHAIDFNYGDFVDPEIPQFSTYEMLTMKKKKYDTLYGKARLSSNYVLSTGKTFNETLEKEYKASKKAGLLETIQQEIQNDIDNGLNHIEIQRKWGDISDVVSGFELNNGLSLPGEDGKRYRIGHSKSYWNNRSTKARGREAFAELGSAKAVNPASYELFKKYFPETTEAFDEITTKLSKGEIKPNEKRAKNQENDNK